MNKKMKIQLLTVVLFFSFIFVANSYNVDRKYTNDYLAIDYVNAKNIIAENRVATDKELKKYDVNNDRKINEDDLLIMRCLICEVFDIYEIRSTRCKAIKYIED